MTKQELSKMIDQTLLSATATKEQVEAFCKEAATYGFASVCINPVYVKLAATLLKGTGVKTCTVIDFPLGASTAENKCAQAAIAIADGAQELDFVVSLGLVKAHDWDALQKELSLIAQKVGKSALSKLIIETCYLTDEEIVESCKCAKSAGFDFVKTSTGFAIQKDSDGRLKANGANTHAVSLMRQTVGEQMGVKASGGIHSTQEALDLIAAGASRLGASAGVQIVNGLN